jgi:hypothetical protein
MNLKNFGILMTLGAGSYLAWYLYKERRQKKLLDFVKQQVAQDKVSLDITMVA